MRDAIRSALIALIRRPLRSALTMFGIQIGIFAVATIATAGAAARDRVAAEIASLGSTTMVLFPEERSGGRGRRAGRLTEEDGRAITREVGTVAALAPALTALVHAEGPRAARVVKLIGTTPSYLRVANWSVATGGGWDERDGLLRARVCVIGQTVRESLFGDADPIGSFVRIGPHLLRVVGVLRAKGLDLFENEQDDVVLSPIETYRMTIGAADPEAVGALFVSATGTDAVARATSEMRALVRQRHRLAPGESDDFKVQSQKEIGDLYRRIVSGLTLLVAALASISLVVGGVGVMNIMLVSVSERTREIGVRMALGSSRWQVWGGFLLEAALISTAGGLLGIASASGLVFVARRALPQWPIHVDFAILSTSVLTSTFIGVLFGCFPAVAASKLDPAIALGRG